MEAFRTPCGRALCNYTEKGDLFVEQFSGGQTSLHQCESCGFCTYKPTPSEEALDSYYQATYGAVSESSYNDTQYDDPNLALVAVAFEEILRKYGCAATPIEHHDYGCALGALVLGLNRAGFNSTGHDLNKDWINHGKLRLGGLVGHSFAEQVPLSRKLHFVSILHVLEHLPHPEAALRDIQSRLDPHGIVYICVPNALIYLAEVLGKRADITFTFPAHLSYFTPKSMMCILQAAGLRLLHLETRPAHLSSESRERFVEASAVAGVAFTSEEEHQRRLQELGMQFRGDELFALACRDDSPIMNGDTTIADRINANVPFEQPTWKRLERSLASKETAQHTVATDDPSLLDWSPYLQSMATDGRLTVLLSRK